MLKSECSNQSAQILRTQDMYNIHVIMKTMCTPDYRHNNFVATHGLGHIIYRYTFQVPVNQRVLYPFHDYMYVHIHTYM